MNNHIKRAWELNELINQKSTKLEALIVAAKEQKDTLLTPKQVTELLILIGELTLVNAGISGASLETVIGTDKPHE